MSLIPGMHMPGVECRKCGGGFDSFDPRIEYVRDGNSTFPQCKDRCGLPLNLSLLGEVEKIRVVAYEEWKRLNAS